jgi:sec-independent protein translocase protein TatC
LAWWAFPRAVTVLLGLTPIGAANLLSAQMFMTFAMQVMLAFGIAFVFPVVMVALTWAGVVPARTWLRSWRWAVVLIFTFAAVATPTPDATTMLLLGIPMCGLYFGAVGVGFLRERAKRKKAEAPEPESEEAA